VLVNLCTLISAMYQLCIHSLLSNRDSIYLNKLFSILRILNVPKMSRSQKRNVLTVSREQDCQIGRKSDNWATLGSRWRPKIGFGALLLFGPLFETLATTLGVYDDCFLGIVFLLMLLNTEIST